MKTAVLTHRLATHQHRAGRPAPPDVASAPDRLAPARLEDPLAALRELARDFRVDEGGQANLLTWNGEAEAAVVVRPDSRVIAGFPSGNSGVSLWTGEGSSLLAAGEPRGFSTSDGQGIRMPLLSPGGELVITEAVMGSIRTIRNRMYHRDGAEPVRRRREDFAELKGLDKAWVRETSRLEKDGEKQILVFTRAGLDGGRYEARLEVDESVTVERRGDAWHLRSTGPFSLDFQASVPHKPLGSYSPEELFSPEAGKVLEAVTGTPREDRVRSSLRGLLFLARKGKFMAGSWRFMTYFGRDTLFSLMLLDPIISQKAYQDGLQSVVDRLSDSGKVAHEEHLGPWAEHERLGGLLQSAHQQTLAMALPHAGAAVLGELSRPAYDHTTVDGDFLLPIAMKKMFDENPAAGRDFLERPSSEGTPNLEKVLSNWNQVLQAAEPFAEAMAAGLPREECARLMVRIQDGLNVGDWRDSQEGLGWGRYPGSVNVNLVANALRAVASMAESLPREMVEQASRSAGLEELPRRLERAGEMAREWNHAGEAFRVRLSPEQVRSRLNRYLDSPSLTEGEKAFYRGRPVGEGQVTLGQFLDGESVPPALRNGLTLSAVSLKADGSPVEVANTDSALRLFAGEPPVEDVENILTLLELEYPVGLMTGVGPVVANPAYSQDEVHHRELGRNAYHGAVVWTWESAMLAVGLLKQVGRFPDRPELQERLRAAAERIARADEAAGPLGTSELWTHRVEGGDWQAAAFGEGSTDRTESNAVQLWSTVYPATLAWSERLD